MRALAGTLASPPGWSSRSPLASTVGVNASGTSTSVPSNSRHGFQPWFRKPNAVMLGKTPTTSAGSSRSRTSSISPLSCNGWVTLTRWPVSPRSARRSPETTDACAPLTKVAPRSTQTRSGWRCSSEAWRRCREVIIVSEPPVGIDRLDRLDGGAGLGRPDDRQRPAVVVADDPADLRVHLRRGVVAELRRVHDVVDGGLREERPGPRDVGARTDLHEGDARQFGQQVEDMARWPAGGGERLRVALAPGP